jgi:hypothetical protein
MTAFRLFPESRRQKIVMMARLANPRILNFYNGMPKIGR